MIAFPASEMARTGIPFLPGHTQQMCERVCVCACVCVCVCVHIYVLIYINIYIQTHTNTHTHTHTYMQIIAFPASEMARTGVPFLPGHTQQTCVCVFFVRVCVYTC